MSLNNNALAMASAVTVAILWMVCSALVALLPGPAMVMTGHLLHIDLSGFEWSISIYGFVTALVCWAAIGGATGWLVATLYNRFRVTD